MKSSKLLKANKVNIVNLLDNFAICSLHMRIVNYPLIFYFNVNIKRLNQFYRLKHLSLIYNYKSSMLIKSKAIKLLSKSNYFRFLESGSCFLVYFSSWSDFFNLLLIDEFCLHFYSLKLIAISWDGYFLNIRDNLKIKDFASYLINLSQTNNSFFLGLIGILFSLIYVVIYIFDFYLSSLIGLFRQQSLCI